MIKKLQGLDLKKLQAYADWKLLLFLLLFLNVKLAIKIPAILIIYLLQFDYKFGFKFKHSRLPQFYLIILILPFIDFVFNKGYTNTNYIFVFLLGTGFWLICMLAVHQVKLSVERNSPEIINRTLIIFFAANAIISLLNLAYIVWETGALNPYTFQGEHQKYFIGTGDYVKGITFDTSTTNAVLNAFGVIYFLTRKNALMVLVCMATLILAGSNFTSLAIVVILLALFAFNSTRDQKSIIAICLVFLIIFMAKISPQNNHYVEQTFNNLIHKDLINKPNPVWYDAPVTNNKGPQPPSEEKKIRVAQQYIDSITLSGQTKASAVKLSTPENMAVAGTGRIYIPKPNLNLAPYQPIQATPPEQKQLVTFIDTHKPSLHLSAKSSLHVGLPGKVIGLLQTINFLRQHPSKILTGNGIGNFSSKLAFRASGIGVTGGYPAKYIYIDRDFEANHLDLYLAFFSKESGYHSLTNSPYSVYDQLLSEYGLLGLLAFLIYYLGFFAKNYKVLTYGIPLLAFMLMILCIDYWFEQLSVMVLFELMLFLNIKEGEGPSQNQALTV